MREYEAWTHGVCKHAPSHRVDYLAADYLRKCPASILPTFAALNRGAGSAHGVINLRELSQQLFTPKSEVERNIKPQS